MKYKILFCAGYRINFLKNHSVLIPSLRDNNWAQRCNNEAPNKFRIIFWTWVVIRNLLGALLLHLRTRLLPLNDEIRSLWFLRKFYFISSTKKNEILLKILQTTLMCFFIFFSNIQGWKAIFPRCEGCFNNICFNICHIYGIRTLWFLRNFTIQPKNKNPIILLIFKKCPNVHSVLEKI